MSQRETNAKRLCDKGIVAVVRAQSSEQLIDVARALVAGGVDCIEITMTTPNALQVIKDTRAEMGDKALVGVGSVLDVQTAQNAIDAGAEFVVSPIFKDRIVKTAHEADLPCVPGCFTPTEIITATDVGADMCKVFPAGHFGPKYFKNILAPMPHLKLTPTGGVNLDTAAEFIKAGACTLGVGSALVTKKALADGDMGEIERLAAEYVKVVAEARAAKDA
ncbi:MAG: bifunctional 4-hydroxy-2-oxoglutarate aldolase/2-dehydro-3-deoxy-phosphogluconate aldolase [Phycisphaerae bacterium]